MTLGLILVASVAVTYAFLPAWLWAPLMAVTLIWEIRWTFELVELANDVEA